MDEFQTNAVIISVIVIVTGLGVFAGCWIGFEAGRRAERRLLEVDPPIRRADPRTKPAGMDKPAEGTRISTFVPTRRRHRGDLE